MNSDDISDSVNDGEILESVGIDHNLSPVVLGLWVKSGVNDLEDTDESIGLQFIGEGGVDDDTVEVVGLVGGGKGGLA